jgi:hypothetical protein
MFARLPIYNSCSCGEEDKASSRHIRKSFREKIKVLIETNLNQNFNNKIFYVVYSIFIRKLKLKGGGQKSKK